jgi:hypothetical protein
MFMISTAAFNVRVNYSHKKLIVKIGPCFSNTFLAPKFEKEVSRMFFEDALTCFATAISYTRKMFMISTAAFNIRVNYSHKKLIVKIGPCFSNTFLAPKLEKDEVSRMRRNEKLKEVDEEVMDEFSLVLMGHVKSLFNHMRSTVMIQGLV